MNWIDHEYLVPILIGSGRETDLVARQIYKDAGIRAHIFAPSFTLKQRFFNSCHKVLPMKEDLLVMSLTAFAESLEEHCFPVIFCDEAFYNFACESDNDVKSLFIVIRFEDYLKKGEQRHDEN